MAGSNNIPPFAQGMMSDAMKVFADGTTFAFALNAELMHESLTRDVVTDFLDSFKQKHPKALLVTIAPGCDEEHVLAVYYELKE